MGRPLFEVTGSGVCAQPCLSSQQTQALLVLYKHIDLLLKKCVHARVCACDCIALEGQRGLQIPWS